jgi:predicted Zn-dependent protease
MIARIVVVACAAVAVVLLAGRLDVARDVARAERIGTSNVPEAQRLFQDAAERTSDTMPLLREAQLLLFAQRPQDAVAVARRATEEEPRNAGAWLVLAQAAEAAGDAELEATARRRLAELVARVEPRAFLPTRHAPGHESYETHRIGDVSSPARRSA